MKKTLYLCDGKACLHCNAHCHLTRDIAHAKNFEFDVLGQYVEKPETTPVPPTTGSKAVPPKYKIKTVFAPNASEEYKRGYFKGYVDGTNNFLKELSEEENRL